MNTEKKNIQHAIAQDEYSAALTENYAVCNLIGENKQHEPNIIVIITAVEFKHSFSKRITSL